tara:strand:- start:4194 stop:4469 length:276 start_codon:yes stop_codon:yes gene_type:complete
MVKRLSLTEQRKLVKALPVSRINAVKKHCKSCDMRGEGLMDILKTVGKILGPVAKELGPTVLKEIIAPFIKKKIKKRYGGKGLKLAGRGHC